MLGAIFSFCFKISARLFFSNPIVYADINLFCKEGREKLKACTWKGQSKQLFPISPADHLLTKKPENCGYEIDTSRPVGWS